MGYSIRLTVDAVISDVQVASSGAAGAVQRTVHLHGAVFMPVTRMFHCYPRLARGTRTSSALSAGAPCVVLCYTQQEELVLRASEGHLSSVTDPLEVASLK